jgi:methylmalonyl-CoA mutase N-terminal domain/subunit
MEALELMTRIDALGGAASAIDAGFQQREIEDAAYEHARAVEAGASVIVGVNRFGVPDHEDHDVLRVDPRIEAGQVARLRAFRSRRDGGAVDAALASLRDQAAGEGNLLYPMRAALGLGATVGEVSSTLGAVFGRYRQIG